MCRVKNPNLKKFLIKSRVFHFTTVLPTTNKKLLTKNKEHMKLKNIKLSIFIFAILMAFTSCNKDDSIFQEDIQENVIENEGDDGSTNGDNQDSSSEGEITLYNINGNNLTKIKDYKVTGTDLELQKDLQKHQEIWALVKKIIPLSHRNRINEFVLYNGEKGESAGFVVQSSEDLSTWKMGIAIDYAYEGGFNANGELAYTIIHEFGHVLTLDKTQVDSNTSENTCSAFYTGEGCARKASFINQSYNKFWKDIWAEFNAAGEDQTKQEAFYTKYSSRFVTNYASTNPGEDSAEVFAVFVTSQNSPSGNTIADQKVKLMYTYTELVNLRSYIRGNINSSAKSSSKSKNTTSFLPEPGSWKQANTFGKANKLHCSH